MHIIVAHWRRLSVKSQLLYTLGKTANVDCHPSPCQQHISDIYIKNSVETI